MNNRRLVRCRRTLDLLDWRQPPTLSRSLWLLVSVTVGLASAKVLEIVAAHEDVVSVPSIFPDL